MGDVRYGSLADILTSPRHVRFTPNSGIWDSSAIVDPSATTDLAQIHKRYFDWDWPAAL